MQQSSERPSLSRDSLRIVCESSAERLLSGVEANPAWALLSQRTNFFPL